jgi:hypothetical protein
MKLEELVDKVMSSKEWYGQLRKSPAELSRIHNLGLNEQQIAAPRKINYESLDGLSQASWKA